MVAKRWSENLSENREDLIKKLFSTPKPKNFTKKELDQLMKKCNCEKYNGGRGSGLKYFHTPTKRVLAFDGPHPGNELYYYQIYKVRAFLIEVEEYCEWKNDWRRIINEKYTRI